MATTLEQPGKQAMALPSESRPPGYSQRPERKELNEIAAKLRETLKAD